MPCNALPTSLSSSKSVPGRSTSATSTTSTTSTTSRRPSARRTAPWAAFSDRRERSVTARSSSAEAFLYTLAAVDSAPEWTLDQAAGLVFGFGLVALYFSSKLIDDYVAVSQRRQLGICEKCGGLNEEENCSEANCPAKRDRAFWSRKESRDGTWAHKTVVPMIVCIGGCCVPVHLLLAFLVAAAHRHGYLTWFKEDWVRFGWWRTQVRALLERLVHPTSSAPAPAGNAAAVTTPASGTTTTTSKTETKKKE